LAASQFNGEEGSGLLSNNEIANKVDLSVQAGDQAVFNMSKQISPVYVKACVFVKYFFSTFGAL
jgi:hypothetical protein